MICDHALLN